MEAHYYDPHAYAGGSVFSIPCIVSGSHYAAWDEYHVMAEPEKKLDCTFCASEDVAATNGNCRHCGAPDEPRRDG